MNKKNGEREIQFYFFFPFLLLNDIKSKSFYLTLFDSTGLATDKWEIKIY